MKSLARIHLYFAQYYLPHHKKNGFLKLWWEGNRVDPDNKSYEVWRQEQKTPHSGTVTEKANNLDTNIKQCIWAHTKIFLEFS